MGQSKILTSSLQPSVSNESIKLIITLFKRQLSLQELLNLKVFVDLMNFDNLKRNILEFETIIETNFATDVQVVLG